MERARENVHIEATTTTDSPLQKSSVDREEESETVSGDDSGFAGGGGEEGGGEEGRSNSKEGGVEASLGSELVADGIRSLIRATWEDVKDWCDEEAEARVRRKDAQVRLHTTVYLFSSLAPVRRIVLVFALVPPVSRGVCLQRSASLYAPLYIQGHPKRQKYCTCRSRLGLHQYPPPPWHIALVLLAVGSRSSCSGGKPSQGIGRRAAGRRWRFGC